MDERILRALKRLTGWAILANAALVMGKILLFAAQNPELNSFQILVAKWHLYLYAIFCATVVAFAYETLFEK